MDDEQAGRPSASSTISRLRPTTFLPAPKPRFQPFGGLDGLGVNDARHRAGLPAFPFASRNSQYRPGLASKGRLGVRRTPPSASLDVVKSAVNLLPFALQHSVCGQCMGHNFPVLCRPWLPCSATDAPILFARFVATMAGSDFSVSFFIGFGSWPPGAEQPCQPTLANPRPPGSPARTSVRVRVDSALAVEPIHIAFRTQGERQHRER